MQLANLATKKNGVPTCLQFIFIEGTATVGNYPGSTLPRITLAGLRNNQGVVKTENIAVGVTIDTSNCD